MSSTSPLISAAELSHLIGGEQIVVLDVRYRLDEPDGRDAYRAGHLPGAVYVSLDDELAEHGDPGRGRHPLPSPERFEASARRWGLKDGDTVIVYDDWNSFAAARAWWMLTDAGVNARVLDGGLSAWRGAGLPLETGESTPEPGTVRLSTGHLPRLDIDEAAALAHSGVLLDVRAPERYRGEAEPLDPAAGHIPGARNAPTTENIGEGGRFLSAGELREKYAALGETAGGGAAVGEPAVGEPSVGEPAVGEAAVGDPAVGVYCGSGVTAAHAVLALTVAGHRAALYPGSWSQWSNTPGRPVATGA